MPDDDNFRVVEKQHGMVIMESSKTSCKRPDGVATLHWSLMRQRARRRKVRSGEVKKSNKKYHHNYTKNDWASGRAIRLWQLAGVLVCLAQTRTQKNSQQICQLITVISIIRFMIIRFVVDVRSATALHGSAIVRSVTEKMVKVGSSACPSFL